MKKVVQMINLECAHCASKMENAIAKLEGVNSVTINFMLQKLTLDCKEENMSDVLQQAQKICKKIEPSCKLKI